MTIPPVLLALPVVFATAGLLAVAVAEQLDPRAFASARPLNMAEAAALGDAAEVLRRLRLAEDPTRVQPIRPHIIAPAIQRATTAEAAMWARELAMVRLLDETGAIVDTRTRHELACLAADLELPEITRYLAGEARCAPGRALERLAERTTRAANE